MTMARIASQDGFRPSMLNRIVDPESEGTSWRRGYSVDQMIDSVRDDLEDLLNTHRTVLDIPEEFIEVRRSIVAYGLPDPASYEAAGPSTTLRICAEIEEVITIFEPRLTDVHATPLQGDPSKTLQLDFKIRATLRVDPSPEVAFVTLLKLTTGEATIRREGG
jgi:type VI secretion system protein ImpF